MTREVEGATEFEVWYASLDASDQEALNHSIDLLIESGPALGRPYAYHVCQSAFPNAKELRAQAMGDPLWTFFAFDPRRCAILLIGGDKTGDIASTNGWSLKPTAFPRPISKS